MDVLLLLARLLLSGVFAAAGATKLADLAGSRRAMRGFGLPGPLAAPAGVALPVAELLVAVLLLPAATAGWAALGAAALLLAFVGAIAFNLARGRTPDCHCFGQLHSGPIGRPTLIRNALLALVALPVAVSGINGKPGTSVSGWLGGLSGAGLAMLVIFLALLGVLVGAVWLMTQLLHQNGRLLARLDAAEAAMGQLGQLGLMGAVGSDAGRGTAAAASVARGDGLAVRREAVPVAGTLEPAAPSVAEHASCSRCVAECESRGGGAACATVCRIAGHCA